MIHSMTGFGRGTAARGGLTATVEMRSVNNRFCEITVRGPRALNEYESSIQHRVKEAFARGRISVQVQLEGSVSDEVPLQVDAAAARGYARLLQELREAAALTPEESPIRLDHLLKYPEVLRAQDASPEAQAATWEAVQEALDEAVAGMAAMRRQEGEALHADLAARIDAIDRGRAAVEARAPERVAEARVKLRERLEEIFADPRVDGDRLEQELTLLADKLDVTEETVRLASHLALFREALASREPVGRKLNFIAQEINREVNTIGSKANDAALTRLAVEMKEELEKIREQVENVE